jgi:hypothetical protein
LDGPEVFSLANRKRKILQYNGIGPRERGSLTTDKQLLAAIDVLE